MPKTSALAIVLASRIVLGLQTIVSRERPPLQPAVVTVGKIEGGTKRNIIPDDVRLYLTVRTFDAAVRRRTLEAIQRIPRGLAMAAGVGEDRMPVYEHLDHESVDATFNDPALTNRVANAMARELITDGSGKVTAVSYVDKSTRSEKQIRCRAVVLAAGDLWLDPATRVVRRGNVEIPLSAREVALLDLLLRHAGEVLSRSQILEHVWDFAYDGTSNVVDVYVRYLREKIDRPFGKRAIETARGFGYRLRPDGG